MPRVLRNPDDRRHVIDGFLQTLGVAAIIGAVLILFNARIGSMIAPLVPDPYLQVVSLEYRDGKIWQLVRAENAATIRAAWAAGINGEDGAFICAGGGVAPYFARREPASFTPDQWTGDDCGGLVPGQSYIGRASWEWIGLDGKPRNTSATLKFVWEG